MWEKTSSLHNQLETASTDDKQQRIQPMSQRVTQLQPKSHIANQWATMKTSEPHLQPLSQNIFISGATTTSPSEPPHQKPMCHCISSHWATSSTNEPLHLQYSQWATSLANEPHLQPITHIFIQWATTSLAIEPPHLHPMSHDVTNHWAYIQWASKLPIIEPLRYQLMSHHITNQWACKRRRLD